MRSPSYDGVIRKWDDLGLLVLSGPTWATRPDGSSQGGYLALLAPRIALDDRAVEHATLDWRSYKLVRVARSSLNAETRAAAAAADAMEHVKTSRQLLHHPDLEVLDPTLGTTAPCALVVDAKSFYDAAKKQTPAQSAAARKRTAVDCILSLRQTLRLTASALRRVSS